MNTVYFDAKHSDEVRRERLYNGQLYVFAPRPSTIALCEFAKELLQEAFAPYDPQEAQHHLPLEQFVTIASRVKPGFIHHPKSKELLKAVLDDFSCDPEKTYFDVPRMKIITSDGYLTSGIGYVYHPHRDSWYSAPQCQLNWWLPIYDIESESSFAFHPHYWSNGIKNGSAEFNYYEYVENGRKNAAKEIKSDTRKQPGPEEHFEMNPQIRLVPPAGGLILFAGAQLHSSVPNTTGVTRFSIDFRTINVDDVVAGRGAPNVDNEATGTALRDFMRRSDQNRLPEEIVRPYDIPVSV